MQKCGNPALAEPHGGSVCRVLHVQLVRQGRLTRRVNDRRLQRMHGRGNAVQLRHGLGRRIASRFQRVHGRAQRLLLLLQDRQLGSLWLLQLAEI